MCIICYSTEIFIIIDSIFVNNSMDQNILMVSSFVYHKFYLMVNQFFLYFGYLSQVLLYYKSNLLYFLFIFLDHNDQKHWLAIDNFYFHYFVQTVIHYFYLFRFNDLFLFYFHYYFKVCYFLKSLCSILLLMVLSNFLFSIESYVLQINSNVNHHFGLVFLSY